MARMALEHALPAGWVDEVFEAHRQQQYSRELLFSAVVDLMTRVSLGLRPSLHAAARQMPGRPVSLASLYDKVNHTKPGILRALVRGGAGRLGPVVGAMGQGAGSLPGWRLRVLDGNPLPASERRLAPLPGFRGAALPRQSLVATTRTLAWSWTWWPARTRTRASGPQWDRDIDPFSWGVGEPG